MMLSRWFSFMALLVACKAMAISDLSGEEFKELITNHLNITEDGVLHRRDLVGGFVKYCYEYIVSPGDKGLYATCVTPTSKWMGGKLSSGINLNLCLGQGLKWQYRGGFQKNNCKSCNLHSSPPRYTCDCGEAEMNLGIWVSHNGVIGCHDWAGAMQPANWVWQQSDYTGFSNYIE